MTDKPEVYGIKPETLPDFRQLLDDYRAGKLHTRPAETTTMAHGTHTRMAKVITSAIAANGTGQAQLQKADWTDSNQAPVDVTSDFPVELPVDTKVYIQTIQGKWRVIVPFMDCA